MNWSGFTSSQEKKSKFSLSSITKQQWIVLLLVGVLLAVIALPVKKEGGGQTAGTQTAWESAQDSSQMTEKERMERQLEEILSQVEGVGEVRVLLSLKEGGDSGFYGTESSLSVQGVLVAAQGVENSVVERNIQQAVMALFPVEAHKIKIMKMI